MIKPDLHDLVSSLDATIVTALEAAVAVCVDHGHHEIRVEHLLLGLLADRRSDFATLVALHGLDLVAVRRALLARCAELRGGNRRTPVLASALTRLLDEARSKVALRGGGRKVRSADVLEALLGDPTAHEASLLVDRLRKVKGGRKLAVVPLGQLVKEAREA